MAKHDMPESFHMLGYQGAIMKGSGPFIDITEKIKDRVCGHKYYAFAREWIK